MIKFLQLTLLFLFSLTTLCLHAQLVPDDDVSGITIESGYDLTLAVGGLNYPSNIAHNGSGTVWVTEAGQPGVPPTVKQFSIEAGTASATEPMVVLTPGMFPPGTLAGPFTDVTYREGMIFLSHRAAGANGWTVGAVSRFDPNDIMGTFQTIVTNLPSTGDHSNNTVVFGENGRAYIGLGSATNSGVVGADNVFRWVPDAPGFTEVAPVDITFRPNGFTARIPTPLDPEADAVTAAYRPFDTGAETTEYTVAAATPASPFMGIIAGSGTVYSFDPTAADVAATMQLEAWGLRNPFGLGFDAADPNRLFISNNGSDVRGQAGDPNDPLNPETYVIQGNRPIGSDYDEMFVINVGGETEFFGWPDFLHDPETNEPLSIDDPLFCQNPTLTEDDCPQPVFAEDFRNGLTVQNAFAPVGPFVSVTGFMASQGGEFGFENDLFVTESGSFSPQTGAFSFTGYKVARFNSQTGEKNDFVVNTGTNAAEILDPAILNKPVAIDFMGDMMLIVDLGVLEPGLDIFDSNTGKVWVVTNGDLTSTSDLKNNGVTVGNITPNPAADFAALSIETETALDMRVTVYDVRGTEIMTAFDGSVNAGTQSVNIPLANLANGNYYVRLQSAKGATTRKFVVLR